MKIFGVDFTSAPRRAKAITVAQGTLEGRVLRIVSLEELCDFPSFEAFLRRPGPWIGGFDFPFGLPRELVTDLRWPGKWDELVRHCGRFSRLEFREAIDGYRTRRPEGRKYAHRATDIPAGSSSPMKLVNPPVALMFFEGTPRLLRSGVDIPGLHRGDPKRVALEAYPGLLARSIVGRASYKNDAPSRQTDDRKRARRKIVSALDARIGPKLKKRLIDDPSGDSLDALLCAVQAAEAARMPNRGLPKGVDPVEGWIATASPDI